MPLKRYTATLTNDLVDLANPQLVGFVSDGTLAEDIAASIVIGYLARVSNTMAAGTRIQNVSVRAAGSAGAVGLAFPTAAYANLKASADANSNPIVAMTDYGVGLGGGSMTPLGTSISVSERTAIVGRTGRGRHFLPFVSRDVCSTGGRFNASAIESTLAIWTYFFRIPVDGQGSFNPQVSNALLTAGGLVTSIKPQPVFSNLESRRR